MQRPDPDPARDPRLVERRSATRAIVDGAERLVFAGCDYLGLAHHPEVRAGASEAVARYGASTGASRATSGSTALHLSLESALADFLGTEAALVVEDGYVADLAVARGLARGAARVHVDAESHPSLLDAATLTGVPVSTFDGDDLTRLHALLDRGFGAHPGEAAGTVRDDAALVLTDGVFTNSGRLARVAELLRVLPSRASTLVVDDSHLVGVLRERGRGSLETHGVADERVVVTASLAKALGAAGGVIAGSAERIARIRRDGAPYIATTALNPASAGAARAALGVLEREPKRVERLAANTGALHRLARRLGLVPRGTFLPILRLVAEPSPAADLGVGVGVGDLVSLARGLAAHGIFAPVIRYPGAPDQLRLTVCSEHTDVDLAALERALGEHLTPAVRAG